MTFCIFSAQYLPTTGGVERYTYNLACQLLRAGHRVIVVTSAVKGADGCFLPELEQAAEGPEVLRLPVWPVMGGRFPVPKPGRRTRRQWRWLWQQGIDFAVIQTRFYPLSVWASGQAFRHRVPALVIEHSTGHMPMGKGFAAFFAHLYEHAACWFQRRGCTDYYGVSQAVCRWLEHFHIQAKGTLYNSVNVQELRQQLEAAPATSWRQKLGYSPDAKLIVFLGRMIPEKGVGELLEVFEQKKFPNTVLVLAGDGPALQGWQKDYQNNPNIRFLGNLSHDCALTLLSQADVYCLPTRYAEGFPTTFLEAAICGCPVITTVTGGTEDLFSDESYGLCISPKEGLLCRQLGCALEKALNDPVWRQTAAQRTRQRVEENYTWQATAQKLLAVAEKAVKG